jgi:hypothetical protein
MKSASKELQPHVVAGNVSPMDYPVLGHPYHGFDLMAAATIMGSHQTRPHFRGSALQHATWRQQPTEHNTRARHAWPKGHNAAEDIASTSETGTSTQIKSAHNSSCTDKKSCTTQNPPEKTISKTGADSDLGPCTTA